MSAAKNYRELKVYGAAREAAQQVYELSKRFPREERFSLTDQIRRSSRAVGAMIAEAWGRRRYVAVFINKLDEALGEATETQAWLDSAFDAGYLTEDEYRTMSAEWERIGAMLSRMIDRASDFSKNAPNTDYRTREESELWGES